MTRTRARDLAAVLAPVLLAGAVAAGAAFALGASTNVSAAELGAVALARTVAARAQEGQDLEATLKGSLVEGVVYAFAVGDDQKLLAHTFGAAVPQGIERRNLLEGAGTHSQRIETDAGPVLDVAVPFRGARPGTAHVGLALAPVERASAAARLWAAQAFALATILGAVVALGPDARRRARLKALREAVGVVADDGRLDRAFVADPTEDELGDLSRTLAKLVGLLRDSVTTLQESAAFLGEAADNLTATAEEQNQMITRQSTALHETQVTAQEINQTSMLATQKAEATLKVAERADEVSRAGQSALERSLGGLGDIRAQVDEITGKITQLEGRTRQIGGITQTVKELADQSNILALNAAIEAVRSGEHGRGFAVVAREIRSLADQSIQATARVREILEDIAVSMRDAVGIAERGSQRTEGSLAQVRSSADSLRSLSDIVRENSAAVRQIVAAVGQQNAGISQIFSAVTDQTKMMEETRQRLEGRSHAAAVFRSLAERVSQLVARYKL